MTRIEHNPSDWNRWLDDNAIERMDPLSGRFPQERAEIHLARYRFADMQLNEGWILDVAWGTGCGTHVLAESAAHVVGVDACREACIYTHQHYKGHKTSFVVARAEALPFADGAFDAAVSFETLEHTCDDNGFLVEIARVLKDEGQFAVSVPHDFSPNSYHFRGYQSHAFEKLLSLYLRVKRLYGLNPNPKPPHATEPQILLPGEQAESYIALAVKDTSMSPARTKHQKRTILVFPTSPVHVRNLAILQKRLPEYRFEAVNLEPLCPHLIGMAESLNQAGIPYFDASAEVETALFVDSPALVLFCAAFEPYAVKLFREAKLRGIPTVAIEEVPQLTLNDLLLNSYELPFDALATANARETELFIQLGQERERLIETGVLNYENIAADINERSLRDRLGIPQGKRVILYTTSPLRGRLAIHSFETQETRLTVLRHLASVLNEDDQLVVKLHPNENVDENRDLVRSVVRDALVFSYEVDVQELLRISALVINRGNSQTAVEAILFDKPLLLVPLGLRNALIDESSLPKANSKEEFISCFRSLIASHNVDYTELKKKYFVYPLEKTSERIAKVIRTAKSEQLTAAECFLLAMSFIDYGQCFTYSLDMARRAAKQDPHNKIYDLFVRAMEAKLSHSLLESSNFFDELITLLPRQYQFHWEMAEVSLKLGNLGRALSAVNDALEFLPKTNPFWRRMQLNLLKARILYELGRYHDLIGLASRFEQEYFFLAPELARLLFDVYLQLERPLKAFEVLSHFPDGQEKREGYYQVADFLRTRTDFKKALEVLDGLPDHDIKWAKIARVHLESRQYLKVLLCIPPYLRARLREWEKRRRIAP